MTEVKFCPNCGAPKINPTAQFCGECGTAYGVTLTDSQSIQSKKSTIIVKPQIFGLIGSLLIIFGCFLPLFSSYYWQGYSISLISTSLPLAVIFIIIAVISIVFVFKKAYKRLYATGITTFALLICVYFIMLYGISIEATKAGYNEWSNLIKFDFAWIFFILGAILLILTPYLEKRGAFNLSILSGQTGSIDQLEKLANLKDRGVITEEEFNKQKEKLLQENK
jgi:hypothetical protein